MKWRTSWIPTWRSKDQKMEFRQRCRGLWKCQCQHLKVNFDRIEFGHWQWWPDKVWERRSPPDSSKPVMDSSRFWVGCTVDGCSVLPTTDWWVPVTMPSPSKITDQRKLESRIPRLGPIYAANGLSRRVLMARVWLFGPRHTPGYCVCVITMNWELGTQTMKQQQQRMTKTPPKSLQTMAKRATGRVSPVPWEIR